MLLRAFITEQSLCMSEWFKCKKCGCMRAVNCQLLFNALRWDMCEIVKYKLNHQLLYADDTIVLVESEEVLVRERSHSQDVCMRMFKVNA